jgi:hypothetical protein
VDKGFEPLFSDHEPDIIPLYQSTTPHGYIYIYNKYIATEKKNKTPPQGTLKKYSMNILSITNSVTLIRNFKHDIK